DIDAVDEQIGVEGWLGDKGQDIARGGLDGHEGATLTRERLFGHPLQVQIEGKSQIAPRHRVGAPQHAYRLATRRDLHGLGPGYAVQDVLIRLFHALLADVLRAPVVGRLAFLLETLGIAGRQSVDIAYDVG